MGLSLAVFDDAVFGKAAAEQPPAEKPGPGRPRKATEERVPVVEELADPPSQPGKRGKAKVSERRGEQMATETQRRNSSWWAVVLTLLLLPGVYVLSVGPAILIADRTSTRPSRRGGTTLWRQIEDGANHHTSLLVPSSGSLIIKPRGLRGPGISF